MLTKMTGKKALGFRLHVNDFGIQHWAAIKYSFDCPAQRTCLYCLWSTIGACDFRAVTSFNARGYKMEKVFEQFLSDNNALDSFVQFSNKVRAYQYRKRFSIISKFLQPEGKALDWGSGNGHLSNFLLHNQQRTTAYGFGESAAHWIIADNPLLEFVAADTKEPAKLLLKITPLNLY